MEPASILIVEDEEFIALDIEARLEGIGHWVVGRVNNGAEALRLARDQQPDLALLDIMIVGDMDGIETGQRLRELGVPVIYLTAHSEMETVQRAAETGPYGFLTKPVHTIELLAGVTVALAKARLERQLREEQQRLIGEQDQLLALIGHEIRTPVAVIQAAVDSLRTVDETNRHPERERRYDRITGAARRIDAMIALASRRDSRSAFAGDNPQPVDLVALTHGVIRDLPAAEQGRVRFSTAETGATVFVGLELMRFVLLNLLDNAIKYAPPESEISLSLRQAALTDVVRWTITDQGRGVAQAERERIFDKFYRSQESSSAPGLGLGLYIARSSIERFGGQLQYVGRESGGACFEITLPAWRKAG